MLVLPDPGAPYWVRWGVSAVACEVSWLAYQEVPAAEGYATLGVPALASQEIACVFEEDVFDAWVEDNGPHRALRATGDMVPVITAVLYVGRETLRWKI